MSNYSPVNIISKTRKTGFGIVVEEGERVKAFIFRDGDATLMRNQNIKFSPEDYDLYVPDELYEKLLNQVK